MEINTINGHTRILGAPSNWDQSKGQCGGLPIMDQETENGPCMISEWQPEADDIKLLNMGMPIHLWVYGNTHPVVSISVGQPTQEAIDKATQIQSIFDASDRKATDKFGHCPKCDHKCADDKSIGSLTMTLHTNTAQLRKTLTDLIACDAYAITFQTMAQYRTAIMKEIEKALADNINIHHDIALMPRSLTAENRAKAALMGEFFVPVQVACNQCDNEGTLSDGTECADCEGTGVVVDHETIDWTTIKAIYAKAVEVCEVKSIP